MIGTNYDSSVFMEASMSDSFIYGLFNSSGEIQKRILQALKEGIPLGESYIEEQLLQMERSRISPLLSKVLEAYKDGYVRLVYWKSTTQKMTKSIPFVLHKSQNGPVVSIFISSFGKLTADETRLNIDMKTLYILMEAGFVALNLQIRPNVFKRNTTIMRCCNEVYTNMFMRVLNRDYALSLDTALHDKVSFTISKFFLDNIWELGNSDMSTNYALQTTTEKNLQSLDLTLADYQNAKATTVEELFGVLKQISPRMQSLTVRYFVERFLNTYGGSSILAIDYLPYVFFMIQNTLAGGFLVSQTTLSDIVKNTKDIRKFYPELSKSV
jgi:hypothetical protein